MGNAATKLVCRCLGDVGYHADLEHVEVNEGGFFVEVAVSELFAIPGIGKAYHTSVLVNGEEFFFSDSGILCDRSLASHGGAPTERLQLGYSSRTGVGLLKALQAHFQPGTYDLIRKNCNSFSDAALYYLLRKRLEKRFMSVERIAQLTSKEMLERFTQGSYAPNPSADPFKIDEVLVDMDLQGDGAVDHDDLTKLSNETALSIGARVTIVGLQNAAELNGKGALIRGFNGFNGRWEVTVISSNETKAVRAENLRPAGEPVILMPGDLVTLHGLKSEAGAAMNQREAKVLRYRHDCCRYEVKLLVGDDGEAKAFKAANLILKEEPVTI